MSAGLQDSLRRASTLWTRLYSMRRNGLGRAGRRLAACDVSTTPRALNRFANALRVPADIMTRASYQPQGVCAASLLSPSDA